VDLHPGGVVLQRRQQLTGPKSRHGRRTIPISHELADRLAVRTVDRDETDLRVVGAQGATLRRP
jgi:hypothetical protein